MHDDLSSDTVLDAAIARHEARDLPQAEILCRAAIEADPANVEALNLLGVVLQDLGRAEHSIAPLSRAIEIDPNYADAFSNLARAHRLLADPESAVTAANRATALDPDFGEGWLQLGYALLATRRNPEALTALKRAIEYFPYAPDLYAGIGYASQNLGDFADAAEAWRTVLSLHPERHEALVNLGAALCQLGTVNDLDEALELHREAVARAPGDTTALGALAVTLHRRQAATELVATCREILIVNPERLDVMAMLITGLIWLGQIDEARAVCRAALKLQPDYAPIIQQLASLDHDVLDQDAMARFRERMDDRNLGTLYRVSAGFALAKAMSRESEHEAAFEMFRAANAINHADHKASGTAFDLPTMRGYTDWARGVFGAPVFEALRPWGNASELPVFIVGMPRSGTSLVEQIAASHPRVAGRGERKDIGALVDQINQGQGNIPPALWDRDRLRRLASDHIARLKVLGGDVDRIIDKMPDNIQLLGQMRLFFPNARIIVCHRDLRDVCVSCFTTHFADGVTWSSDLVECGQRAVEIERLTAVWRDVVPGAILEIDYETLVRNLERESRRLIAFLGLEWDPACLDFHKTDREVTTASALQVRQPLYDTSIGRWRRYETHLGPLLAELRGHFPADAPGNAG